MLNPKRKARLTTDFIIKDIRNVKIHSCYLKNNIIFIQDLLQYFWSYNSGLLDSDLNLDIFIFYSDGSLETRVGTVKDKKITELCHCKKKYSKKTIGIKKYVEKLFAMMDAQTTELKDEKKERFGEAQTKYPGLKKKDFKW